MTGYGSGEATDGVRAATAEIRTVNHRYAEITVKLPRRYSFAEDAVKQAVKTGISRGKIDIYINLSGAPAEEVAVAVNTEAAREYMKGIRALENELKLSVGSDQLTLYLLASQPDIFRTGNDDINREQVTEVIVTATLAAAADLSGMRESEGAKLADDLIPRTGRIRELLDEIEKRAPELAGIYQEKLKARVDELLGGGSTAGVDIADRLAIEVAIFADKSNITEEIVRLRSHLSQFEGILNSDASQGPVGKKLDFIVQEMNREANTIGSKSNDLKITDTMIEMKSEIEKIREQIQNIE